MSTKAREKNVSGTQPDSGERLAAVPESCLHVAAHIFHFSPLVSFCVYLVSRHPDGVVALPGWSYGIAKCVSMVWQAGLALRGEWWHSSHHPGSRAHCSRVLHLCLRVQKTDTAERNNNRKIIMNEEDAEPRVRDCQIACEIAQETEEDGKKMEKLLFTLVG